LRKKRGKKKGGKGRKKTKLLLRENFNYTKKRRMAEKPMTDFKNIIKINIKCRRKNKKTNKKNQQFLP